MILDNTRTPLKSQLESKMVQTIMGCLLIVLGAQISIPLHPVPITLQTMAVLFIGLTMPARSAASAGMLYIICGLAGLPVFGNFQANPMFCFGTTAGYIASFPVSAYIISKIVEKHGNSVTSMSIACLIGTCITFTMGLSWLTTIIGFNNAISTGFLPFIVPGALKAIFLISLLKFVRKI